MHVGAQRFDGDGWDASSFFMDAYVLRQTIVSNAGLVLRRIESLLSISLHSFPS